MHLTTCYLLYLALAAALTFSIAYVLKRNGRIFLLEAFHGNVTLTDSVASLLLIGFYLFNAGYIILSISGNGYGYNPPLNNPEQIFSFEASKIGWLVLLLGISHFFNMLVLSLIRHGGRSASPATA